MKIFRISKSGRRKLLKKTAGPSVRDYGKEILSHLVRAEEILEEERSYLAKVTRGGKDFDDDFKKNFEDEYQQLIRTLEFSHTLANLMATGDEAAWAEAKDKGITRTKFQEAKAKSSLFEYEGDESAGDSGPEPSAAITDEEIEDAKMAVMRGRDNGKIYFKTFRDSMRIDDERASLILDELERLGIVGPESSSFGVKKRDILITWEDLKSTGSESPETASPEDAPSEATEVADDGSAATDTTLEPDVSGEEEGGTGAEPVVAGDVSRVVGMFNRVDENIEMVNSEDDEYAIEGSQEFKELSKLFSILAAVGGIRLQGKEGKIIGDRLGKDFKTSPAPGPAASGYDPAEIAKKASVVNDVIYQLSFVDDRGSLDLLKNFIKYLADEIKGASSTVKLFSVSGRGGDEVLKLNSNELNSFRIMRLAYVSDFDISAYRDKIQQHYNTVISEVNQVIKFQQAFVYYVEMMAKVVRAAYRDVSYEMKSADADSATTLESVLNGLGWIGRLVENMKRRGQSSIKDWEGVKENGLEKMTPEEMESLVDENNDKFIDVAEFWKALTEEAVHGEVLSDDKEEPVKEDGTAKGDEAVREKSEPVNEIDSARMEKEQRIFDVLSGLAKKAEEDSEGHKTTESLLSFVRAAIGNKESLAVRIMFRKTDHDSLANSDLDFKSLQNAVLPMIRSINQNEGKNRKSMSDVLDRKKPEPPSSDAIPAIKILEQFLSKYEGSKESVDHASNLKAKAEELKNVVLDGHWPGISSYIGKNAEDPYLGFILSNIKSDFEKVSISLDSMTASQTAFYTLVANFISAVDKNKDISEDFMRMNGSQSSLDLNLIKRKIDGAVADYFNGVSREIDDAISRIESGDAEDAYKEIIESEYVTGCFYVYYKGPKGGKKVKSASNILKGIKQLLTNEKFQNSYFDAVEARTVKGEDGKSVSIFGSDPGFVQFMEDVILPAIASDASNGAETVNIKARGPRRQPERPPQRDGGEGGQG